jgi:hypothetical protein
VNINDVKIWVSPLTNKIYIGTISKNGKEALVKREVTIEAINAVSQHLDSAQLEYESEAGTLRFRRAEDAKEVPA